MAWLVFPLYSQRFDPYIKRGLITITVLITSSLGLFLRFVSFEFRGNLHRLLFTLMGRNVDTETALYEK